MLNLLFKSTAIYIIWQKFKKQIILVLCSILLISFIGIIYDDLFQVLKVSNKESISALLFAKWFLITFIIAINIYVLRRTKIDKNHDNKDNKQNEQEKQRTKIEEEIISKETILNRTDLILKKYLND